MKSAGGIGMSLAESGIGFVAAMITFHLHQHDS